MLPRKPYHLKVISDQPKVKNDKPASDSVSESPKPVGSAKVTAPDKAHSNSPKDEKPEIKKEEDLTNDPSSPSEDK
jgi:hypothetical protein